jgi:hypothetical protein
MAKSVIFGVDPELQVQAYVNVSCQSVIATWSQEMPTGSQLFCNVLSELQSMGHVRI